MEHKKNMIKLFEKVAYKNSLWQVYSDFLEMAAITLSNSVDFINRSKREERYMEIIKQYSKEEGKIFPELFAELVMALEDEPTDVLGELFMELNLGSKWKGQVFTPMSICKVIAEIELGNIASLIKQKGFITVSEPTCGGGALIIAMANVMKEKDFDYQKVMKVQAVDLDIKAVHMCYIQLSLLGIPAVVIHGNTLTMEMFDEWKTPFYILGGWQFRKQKEPIKLVTREDGQMAMF